MKNKFGLLNADLEMLISILELYPKVERAIIFGSRAKGNNKHGSDVDIALKGAELDFDSLTKISYQLNEETQMPYLFDILNYHKISEPALTEHIDRIGLEIYSRQKKQHSPINT